MQRRLEFEGCFNFRDLGGYPTHHGRCVRWRRLFRSDALHHLTEADVARCTGELDLRAIIDLRSSQELEAEGRGLLSGAPTPFHHVPLFDGDTSQGGDGTQTLADRYFGLVEFARAPIARVLALLADCDGPAVYHCAAGKDRTGVVSALVLGLLGVEDGLIVADYAASQEQLDAIVARLIDAEGYRTVLATLPPDTLHARPETMEGLLERLRDRYASVEGYARAIGLPDAALARLRARLLE